jgi:hypothetical protein
MDSHPELINDKNYINYPDVDDRLILGTGPKTRAVRWTDLLGLG